MLRLDLIALWSVLFTGAGATDPPAVVTEAEFLSVLDDAHPAVVARSQGVAIAGARLAGAATLADPELAVQREGPTGSTEQTDVTLSWQLPHGDRRRRIRAREGDLAAAQARAMADRWSLRLDLRRAYAEWALAAARRSLLEGRASRVEALAKRERARAERGETSGLAARRLALTAAALRGQADLAAAGDETSEGRARTWAPELPEGVRPMLPPLPPAAVAAGSSLRLSAARAELGAARLEREAASRVLPSPAFSIGWQRLEGEERTHHGAIFGIAWSLPLLDRKRSEKALAEARIAGAAARLEATRREVDKGMAAALSSYRRLAAAVLVAEAAVAGNEALRAGAEAAFRLGEASLTDFLETLRAAGEAELNVLQLLEAALAAHREIERLSGPPERTGLSSVKPAAASNDRKEMEP